LFHPSLEVLTIFNTVLRRFALLGEYRQASNQ
jgi:hypothetical protein